MKKIILTQLITLSLLLFSNPIFAQNVDSVKLIPAAPTTEDEIKIVYYNSNSCFPFVFKSSEIDIQDDQIEMRLYYEEGMGQTFSYSIDTVTIGYLSVNDYSVKTIFNMNNIYEDTADYIVTFFVRQPSNIAEIATEKGIDIFPNPFTSEININSNLDIEKIEFYSIEGKRIEVGENNAVLSRRINLSGLKQGGYLMMITDGNGRKYAKKIIKRL